MSELYYYTALSANQYIGPKKYIKIMEEMGSLESFFALKSIEQMKLLNVKAEKAVAVFTTMLEQGKKIVDICEQRGIGMVTIDETVYPQRLRDIEDPPFLLYFIGELIMSIPLLAIVGTRNTTEDGKTINRYFSTEFAGYNIGIVSGLALGHDAIAQQAVVDNNGYTIAVLGSGVDVAYPQANKKLYDKISQQGAIISEFPPGTKPERWHFPYRNRIISGLSDAILIMQAPEKSGALITAKYALEQGKPLYVIPGNPMEQQFNGTNNLIKEGAKVAVSPDDIVIDLLGTKPPKKEHRDINKMENLSDTEKTILTHIKDSTHIDEIVRATEISIAELNAHLIQMELNGLIMQYPGQFYERLV